MLPNKSPKTIFVLIDGIGDLSLPQLSFQTPLQSTPLPTYDLIAQTGLTGLMDPVETGLACGSDTAHMNIFGYNPFKEYRGRGAFETLGTGIHMDLDEIGFKCNFAYMNPETWIVEKRRVDREFDKWGIELIDAINGLEIPGYKDYKCSCVHATEHRCAIKITGKNLSSRITSTDPLKDGKKLKVVYPKEEKDPKSVLTASIVNSLSNAIFTTLQSHPLNKSRLSKNFPPANIILLRGCGSRLKVESFEKVHGMKGFMIAPTAIINGLGQSIYMDIVKVKGATGDYNSDYTAKATALIKNICREEYDFGFLHIKAVDDAGHDKSLVLKCDFYKKIEEMLVFLIKNLSPLHSQGQEFILCLTGDHTTPIDVGDHTFEPVPFAITTIGALLGVGGKLMELRDSVQAFDEVSCAEGCLGRFSGGEVMGIIKRFKEVVKEISSK